MTVTFTSSDNAVSAAPVDLITSALYELNVLAQGEILQPGDAAWGLEKLQRLIDSWNARREMFFSQDFVQYNLIANHAPHTIGPGGDFNVPIRPIRIVNAAFILNSGSQAVDSPIIKIHDHYWWAALPVKSQTSSIVTDLYYAPAQPLGQCNFWPICTGTGPVRLETWTSLAQALNMTTKLGFVQGYWDAVVTTLAMTLANSYEKPISPDLRENNRVAMAAIYGNNADAPQIAVDGGMPNTQTRGIPAYDFLTGLLDNY